MSNFLFVCNFCLFLCTVTDFSAAEKVKGVKFFVRVGLLSGQVFSPFGEDWLPGSHGSGGNLDDRCPLPMKDYSDDRCAFLGTNIEASGSGRWAFGTGGGGVD